MSPNPPYTPRQFYELFNRIEQHLEARYGLPVILTDVNNPFTGDLDGGEVRIDYEVSPEEAVFILIHLFGHTVQWNTDPTARETSFAAEVKQSEERIQALHVYEMEAVAYSQQLLHELGVRDLDQWVADYAHCDFRYLTHLYRTGEKVDFHSFWEPDQPLIAPKPIPPFRPERWRTEWEGTVY